MKTKFTFLDRRGRRVSRDEAVYVVVAVYDDEGNLVEETFGLVGRQDEAED